MNTITDPWGLMLTQSMCSIHEVKPPDQPNDHLIQEKSATQLNPKNSHLAVAWAVIHSARCATGAQTRKIINHHTSTSTIPNLERRNGKYLSSSSSKRFFCSAPRVIVPSPIFTRTGRRGSSYSPSDFCIVYSIIKCKETSKVAFRT